VLNSCAVIVPVTVKSPSNVSVVFFNLLLSIELDNAVIELLVAILEAILDAFSVPSTKAVELDNAVMLR